jgi:hypothetical protein
LVRLFCNGMAWEFSTALFAVATLGVGAPLALAQNTPAPNPPAASPIFNPTPAEPASAAAPAPERPRAISPEVAAQFAAARAKFTPAPPPPPPKPEEEQTDLRDVDKPRNSIIRLPKYMVRERPPPVLVPKQVEPDNLARSRYLSEMGRALNRFFIPGFMSISATGNNSPDRYALEMYREEQRLQNMADLNDAARMMNTSSKSEGTYIKRASDQTYMRNFNDTTDPNPGFQRWTGAGTNSNTRP